MHCLIGSDRRWQTTNSTLRSAENLFITFSPKSIIWVPFASFFQKSIENWITLTPMIALSSVMVTCLARSTALATCCWCYTSIQIIRKGWKHFWILFFLNNKFFRHTKPTSCDKKGRICAIIAFKRLAISVWKRQND